jgi:hypothetical protein
MKEHHLNQLPKARTEQLIVKEVDDEVLVYDLKTDQAHCLNKTAAIVWRNCDGASTVDNIASSAGKEINADLGNDVICLALDQLEKFHLLENVPMRPTYLAGMSRRALMRNLGVAAVALPVILSIAAPTAVEAASCNTPTGRPGGCPCTLNSQCASNNCLGNNTCHA